MQNKISIICSTYNAQETLPFFLNSIRNQTSKKFELIIVDGGSDDKTIDIIKNNIDIISNYRTEPDKGIYDAWNKGIKLTTNDWICFVGSDDVLKPNFVERYLKEIDKYGNDNIQYISSKVNYIDSKGKILRVLGNAWRWDSFKKNMTVAHVGSLHHRSLFKEVGEYDIDFQITGDYELLLREGSNLRALFIDQVLVDMKAGGVSLSLEAIREKHRAHIKSRSLSRFMAFCIFIIDVLLLFKFKIEILFRRL